MMGDVFGALVLLPVEGGRVASSSLLPLHPGLSAPPPTLLAATTSVSAPTSSPSATAAGGVTVGARECAR
jgi:hypothetical protein